MYTVLGLVGVIAAVALSPARALALLLKSFIMVLCLYFSAMIGINTVVYWPTEINGYDYDSESIIGVIDPSWRPFAVEEAF